MNTGDLKLPGYRLIGTLGEGGFGQVFRALHEGSGREVAIKVVLDDQNPEALGRFQDEARILQALQGQNVPKALDLGMPPEAPVPYLAMELIEGVAMNDLLRAQATVPGRLEVLRYVVPGVCKGLQALHEQGAVHRDLKPENMMWRRADKQGVLIDLGLVKAGYLPPKTATGFVLGTPAYMAPEQLTGKTKVYGPETDVYQMGLVLLLALEGRFEDPAAHEIDAAVRRCTHGVERLDARLEALGVSPQLAAWIRGATEGIPDGRTVGLKSLAEALASTAAAAPTSAARPGAKDVAATPVGGVAVAAAQPEVRNWAPMAGAVGFVLGGLVAGFLGGGDGVRGAIPTPSSDVSVRLAGEAEVGLYLNTFLSQGDMSEPTLSEVAARSEEARAPRFRRSEIQVTRNLVTYEFLGSSMPEALRRLVKELRERLEPGKSAYLTPPGPFVTERTLGQYLERVPAQNLRDLPQDYDVSGWPARALESASVIDKLVAQPSWAASRETLRAINSTGGGTSQAIRVLDQAFADLVWASWAGLRTGSAAEAMIGLDSLFACLGRAAELSLLPSVEPLLEQISSQSLDEPFEAMLVGLLELYRADFQAGWRRGRALEVAAAMFAYASSANDRTRIPVKYRGNAVELNIRALYRLGASARVVKTFLQEVKRLRNGNPVNLKGSIDWVLRSLLAERDSNLVTSELRKAIEEAVASLESKDVSWDVSDTKARLADFRAWSGAK